MQKEPEKKDGFWGKIDLGHSVTIATTLLAIGISWGTLNSKTDEVVKTLSKISDRVEKLDDRSNAMHDKQIEMDFRLRSIERTQNRSERLAIQDRDDRSLDRGLDHKR